jgi:hypothetical protein
VTDVGTQRHPRIAFYCQKSSKQQDRVRIRTGTVIANQSHSVSDSSSGSALVSTRSDDQGVQIWTADIANNGSDFLTDPRIIFEFLAHKKFVITFASASEGTIVDEYLTHGLSIRSLRTDCPRLFTER